MRFAFLILASALLAAGLATVRADEASDEAESRGFSRADAQLPVRRVTDYWENRVLMPLVWNPDPTQPLSKIEVQLKECKLFVYQGERLVGATSISCGKEGFDTQPGVFQITQKDKDHRSNMFGSFVDANGKTVVENVEAGKIPPPPGTRYEGASMPWFLRMTDTGTGLHAGYVTGNPASHGCIRLPPVFAEDLFNAAQIGTIVEVKP